LTFQIDGLSKAYLAADILRALSDLLESPPRRSKVSSKRLLLRDALVALDARSAGASHREAAEVIFGVKRVREDWSSQGGWLKERMRRALAKGEELRDGGYRKLLHQACRF
jgi:hypothetical protein